VTSSKYKSRSKTARVEGGTGTELEEQVDDVAALRRENKLLKEENALLKSEVNSWRAKAKERHTKCLALKAVIKAVENREGEVDEVGDQGPKKPKEQVTKETDFMRATVTWEECGLPKSRFDESMRPRIVMLPL
jgi:hypothetical protein